MNNLKREKVIFYNSNVRDVGEAIYDHTAVLPTDLLSVDHDERGVLELLQFSSKMSYYNIDDLRNASFTYSEDGNGTTTTCSIVNGSYSIKTLKTALQTALNLIATDLTWVITLNEITMKFSYAYTGTPVGDVIFTPVSGLTTFNILGFENVAKTMTASETSTKICSIGNIEALFLKTSVSHSEGISDHHTGRQRTTLAEIPCLAPFFGVIYWERSSDYSPKILLPDISSLSSIDFFIQDKYNNYVRLTEDYTMVFKFSVYSKENIDLKKMETLMNLNLLNNMENKNIK